MMLESIHEFAKFAAAAGHYIDLGLSSEQVILLFRECYLIAVHHNDDELKKFCGFTWELVFHRDIMLPQAEALGSNSEILKKIGDAYEGLNEPETAIDYYQRSMHAAQETGSRHEEMVSNLKIGRAYISLGCQKDAIPYLMKSAELAEANKLDVELLACFELGQCYQSLNQHKEAIVYFDHCITLAHYHEHNDLFLMYEALVDSYIELKEYCSAVQACRMCISLAKEQKDKEKELEAELLLTHNFRMFEKYEYAILYGKRCLELAKKSGSIVYELRAYLELVLLHKGIGNSSQVIKHCHTCLELIEKYPQVDVGREFKVGATLLLAKELSIREQYDDAIMYGERCYEIVVEKELGERLIGRVCFHLALTCFLQSQCFSKRTDGVIKENHTELEMPTAHSITQSKIVFETALEKAIHYSSKAISVSKGHDLLKGYSFLAKGYSFLGKHQEVIDNIMLYLSNHNDHFYNCQSSTCKDYTMGCLLLLANSKNQLKFYKESVQFATRCATFAKECSDKETQCQALLFAGNGHESLDQLDKAYFYFNEGLKLAEELQIRATIQTFKSALRRIHRLVGIENDPQSKDRTGILRIVLGENAVKLYKDVDDCVSENNYRRALSCFEQTQALLEDQNLQHEYKLHGKYLNMINIGDTYCYLKEYNNALTAYNKALQYLKVSSDKGYSEAECHFKISWMLVEIHGANGLPDAEKCIRKAIECFERVLSSLGDNEKLSISYVDSYMQYYNTLTTILLESNRNEEALEVLDCYRARSLKRQLLSSYEIKKSDVSTGELQFKQVQSLVCDNNFAIVQYCVPRHFHKLYVFLVIPENEGKLLVYQQKECNNELLETYVELSLNQLNVRDMNCEDRSIE